MKQLFKRYQPYLRSTAAGGLSVYWVIVIGIILVSGYMVGGLIPKRFPPPVKGQAISFNAPVFTDKQANLQMRSIDFQGCKGRPSVLFLIDSSEVIKQNDDGSSARKLDLLKSALLLFGTKLADQALVGIMTYSDPAGNDPKLRLPMKKLTENRPNFEQVVAELDASGLVYFKEGMESAEEVLKREIKNNPGYQFNLVVIANSIPRTAVCVTDPRNATCQCKGGNNCFAKDQDPTGNPDVAKRIRDMGVNVYSIGLESFSSDDKAFTQEFKDMTKKIASSPESRYYRAVPSATRLSETLGTIGETLCLEDEQAAGSGNGKNKDKNKNNKNDSKNNKNKKNK